MLTRKPSASAAAGAAYPAGRAGDSGRPLPSSPGTGAGVSRAGAGTGPPSPLALPPLRASNASHTVSPGTGRVWTGCGEGASGPGVSPLRSPGIPSGGTERAWAPQGAWCWSNVHLIPAGSDEMCMLVVRLEPCNCTHCFLPLPPPPSVWFCV